MQPWYEDDRFWAGIEHLLFDEAKRASAGEEASNAVKLLGVEPGAAILDLCCGPGRHSVALARQGFCVTGVDRTTRYLDHARALAGEQGAAVEWVHEDMRAFRRPAAFDGAINLYTSFGYFEDPEEDRRVLANVRESLRPGARMVMDIASSEVLARIYRPTDWSEGADGSLLLQYREVLPGWRKMRHRWISIRGTDRAEFEFTHRLFSAAELTGEFERAGFSVEGTYGALDGRPYDVQALRLVVVARA